MRKLYKQTKWLRFFIVERKPKTVVVRVCNTANQGLGDIRWHPPWRQYVWQTLAVDAYFNNACLQEIADVLSDLNDEHKRSCDGVV